MKKYAKWFYIAGGVVLLADIYGGYKAGLNQEAPAYFKPLTTIENLVPFGIPLWAVLLGTGGAIHIWG